jgi:hypothetical protein
MFQAPASRPGRCGPASAGHRRRRLLGPVLLVATAALLVAGCSTIRSMFPQEREQAAEATRLLQLQERNMRFADFYVGTLIDATRPINLDAGDAQERYALSGWMLAEANSAYTYASEDNAVLGCLDLVTLATLSHMVAEEFGPKLFPLRAKALVEAHRELEKNAWTLSGEVLTQQQQADLRTAIDTWRDQHPASMGAPFVRFQQFVTDVPGETHSRTLLPSSLIGLVGLDPLSGLDPAVRQVEQSRLLAARALYYAQRVPILMDLQFERTLNRIAAGPESLRLQSQVMSLTESAQRFAKVAEALPGDLSTEREALIQQLNETLTAQAGTLRPLLADLKGSLEAGSAAADAVDRATSSLDALMAKFQPKPGEPAGKPFDIADYTQAAAEVARAADELDRLLGTVDAGAPKLGQVLGQGAEQGRALVDYFFVRVVWLIVLLCAGLLATLLIYRKLATRAPGT